MPMTCATRLSRLTAENIATYHRDGYLLPTGAVLPATDFSDLQSTFERLQAAWVAQGGRPEAMDVPHFYFPELMRFLLHPAVLDLVEPLIGPDIALFSSHFICKPPGDGKRVPWHEDSAYWKRQLDPMEVVTVWLALDPSTPENGCMQVIPRSHANGYSRYQEIDAAANIFDTEIAPGQFDPAAAVPCVLAPNQCSLHHAKAIHGSAPNRSARRRCGYTMRYVATSSRFSRELSQYGLHQIYLARGRDRAGNTYGDPSQPNAAWVERFGVFCPKGH